MDLMNAKGTRDFLPEQKILRDSIVEKIKLVFERYGFSPIETPVFERMGVLGAKFAAGEQSDTFRETFKLEDQGKRQLGLKYDLTVPMCRVVGMNPNLKMPFKRYQIERVYRDGPVEANRYREFLQCDFDTVGVKSMLIDAEAVKIIEEVYKELGLKAEVKVNNRKILDEIMEKAGVEEKDREGVLVSIDKLDKISEDEVREELEAKGTKGNQANELFRLISLDLQGLEKELGSTEGILETKELFGYCKAFNANPVFSPSMVRGLAYYTGPVFEAWSREKIVKGSLGGGGRYDKMIQLFLGSEKEFPATGFSFGIERIMDALEKKSGERPKTTAKFYCFGVGIGLEKTIGLVQGIREKGMNADMDFLGRSASKNLAYANSQGIRYCLILGENETRDNCFTLKDMKTGKQETLKMEKLENLKDYK